jgi:hypothetical protein
MRFPTIDPRHIDRRPARRRSLSAFHDDLSSVVPTMSRHRFSASCINLRKRQKIIYWERYSQSAIFPISVWENPR